MNKNLMITTVITLLVAGGGGFFAGMKYQESKTPTAMLGNGQTFQAMNGNGQGFPSGSGSPSANGSRQGFVPVSGEIVSIDGGTMTIKSSDGSNKIVILGDSTTISKSENGTVDDLKEGETIVVMGTESTEGTITAQNIQLGGSVQGMRRGM